ncbi:MAG TPA: aminoacyl-tRNA hydrolase [Gammaproteobacteria bacterium]
MTQPIALIVGLGNPDREHLTTRHNAGFWFVDALAERHGGRFASNRKLEGDIAEVDISGHRVRLLKPTTYMNQSGNSVAKTLAYYKIAPTQLLVVHDELDFPPGHVKLKFGGGHAGHNGMRSVIEHVGADLWRLRIGVGHPGPGRKDEVIDHVLRRASRGDEELIVEAIARALDCVPALLAEGPERVMNRLHAPKPDAPGADDESDSD